MPELSQVKRTLGFARNASGPHSAIAVICDLKDFSQFLNHPDVQEYVPKFLNHIYNALSILFFGGDQYWIREDERDWGPIQAPVHEKFLGDGALYIWTADPRTLDELAAQLANRLWNLQNRFHAVLEQCRDDVPVVALPSKLRFGLARGTVYELTRAESGAKEYIGFCINLASRLQKYCPELAFIASARLGIPGTSLAEYGYKKVVATAIKGFPEEIVIVDRDEFEVRLTAEIRDTLFREL